ncbi:checkpoint protein HUS1 isoform X1 [Teleopsis dalmanni]|uniref:checkpoint protein HUS1 isoform X1 n=1 Tax=Teleopsis dalmanni TaxID=139649 RepID=UPI0018CD7333|nr:checkpoint protein HUS1 isoform X1 [Teleopsis dalmanni]
MKFRAMMVDPQYMREFQNIVITLSKLTKECVLNISRNKIYFIANEESGTVAPLVWVEIDASLYFSEYAMEGAKDKYQQIMLAIPAVKLGRALGSLRSGALYCKIKLTNIQFPCLTVEFEVKSHVSDQIRKVVHDVPVNVIPRSDWSHYDVPEVPLSKIILNVPSNRLMRGLIDKMKNLSPTIVFHAMSTGELNLIAETEMATVTTRYKDLEVRAIHPSETDKEKEHIEASCSVDCKKTSLLFSSLQVPTLELSCGIDDERLLHMEVNVRQGVTIHSIIPAVCV